MVGEVVLGRWGLVYHDFTWLGVCSGEIISCCPNWFRAYWYSSFGNRILDWFEATGLLANLFGVFFFFSFYVSLFFLLALWIEGLVNKNGFFLFCFINGLMKELVAELGFWCWRSPYCLYHQQQFSSGAHWCDSMMHLVFWFLVGSIWFVGRPGF